MLDWKALMNAERFADRRLDDDPERSPFERDQDRIIYKTAFRRLAGKTQVFPLPQSDATHNRLTHTLEVSTVGRSLARSVAAQSFARDNHRPALPSLADVGAAAGAACLAHDIGNPPFGHAGEAAIAEYFSVGPGQRFIDGLTAQERADFEQFEGNALGFRILTRTDARRSDTPGGLRLTFATLGAFLKYPTVSRPARPHQMKGRIPASEKKFCAFQGDRESLAEVANKLQLRAKQSGDVTSWYRHPLAFVVEAADDICNRVIDLEDAFRSGLVSEKEASDLLHDVIEHKEKVEVSRLKGIKEANERMGYLRARAINVLVNQAAERFIANEDGISSGEFDEPLVAGIPSQQSLAAMEDLMRDNVYSHRDVVAIEAAGFDVLGGLLEAFLVALLLEPKSRRSKTLLLLARGCPFEPASKKHTHYDTVLDVVEYVAGMTDSYAIDFYRTIRGIELPNY